MIRTDIEVKRLVSLIIIFQNFLIIKSLAHLIGNFTGSSAGYRTPQHRGSEVAGRGRRVLEQAPAPVAQNM